MITMAVFRGAKRLLAILLLACLLVGGVGAAELVTQPAAKTTVSSDAVNVLSVKSTDITLAKADYTARKNTIPLTKITSVQKPQRVAVSVEATPRQSGGITVELFCPDNTGRFMAVWGGSVTKAASDWDFSLTDIRRQNTDGCYFAVVDTTAEMMI